MYWQGSASNHSFHNAKQKTVRFIITGETSPSTNVSATATDRFTIGSIRGRVRIHAIDLHGKNQAYRTTAKRITFNSPCSKAPHFALSLKLIHPIKQQKPPQKGWVLLLVIYFTQVNFGGGEGSTPLLQKYQFPSLHGGRMKSSAKRIHLYLFTIHDYLSLPKIGCGEE